MWTDVFYCSYMSQFVNPQLKAIPSVLTNQIKRRWLLNKKITTRLPKWKSKQTWVYISTDKPDFNLDFTFLPRTHVYRYKPTISIYDVMPIFAITVRSKINYNTQLRGTNKCGQRLWLAGLAFSGIVEVTGRFELMQLHNTFYRFYKHKQYQI